MFWRLGLSFSTTFAFGYLAVIDRFATLLVPTTHHKKLQGAYWRLDGLILIGLIIYFNFKEQTL